MLFFFGFYFFLCSYWIVLTKIVSDLKRFLFVFFLKKEIKSSIMNSYGLFKLYIRYETYTHVNNNYNFCLLASGSVEVSVSFGVFWVLYLLINVIGSE